MALPELYCSGYPEIIQSPPIHVICNAPLVAPIPLPYHSPTFLQFDLLPDIDQDLSRPPYTCRSFKRKRPSDDPSDPAPSKKPAMSTSTPHPHRRPSLRHHTTHAKRSRVHTHT
ncbi:hypothetical protein H0H81_001426 [Sphagnurus paluster]|uniref:Uncharacterized protein n=1 Tax=Sphagnurus paluster TaxID=117069 RepID=A0A9P7KN72_9AGAR|nr:hypothetical protein H0H81_001426 [Sphagnurus paluster]